MEVSYSKNSLALFANLLGAVIKQVVKVMEDTNLIAIPRPQLPNRTKIVRPDTLGALVVVKSNQLHILTATHFKAPV
jgi:hypothetical protein